MSRPKIPFEPKREYELNETMYFMRSGIITEGHIYGWMSEVHTKNTQAVECSETLHYKVRYRNGSDWSTTTLTGDTIHRTKLEVASIWFKKQGIREEEILQYCLDDIRDNKQHCFLDGR